ncbi:GNAT family N-acetyltransferase [Promicromonospora sukumoe]|uniref:RimJ/RimL family protein N-acetyltransferase n=1 Tax=Promicromonospora sukumoe TaxID=88382 RepID=A0A7W3PEF7_9MICO|nr:GNAT family N-acetyltransferase [Promicromonospora sukumoe]MBA8808721.1 RimJ/RimL family protein N-acetyltransferase [Promicromonospora sukumoe]
MAELAPYTITPGTLARLAQPTLPLTGGATMRPWRETDALALQEAYADPDIQRWHVRRVDSPDEALGMIVNWQRAWAQERRLEWAVAAADGSLLGRLALKDLVLFDGIAEIAYWTVPAARGRGVAPQAVVAASAWAFEAGFRRLELEHSTLNAASCRVAEKAGFALEGTRRGAARHADGHHDMHVHARLSDAGGALPLET